MKKTIKAYFLYNTENQKFDVWGFKPYGEQYINFGCKDVEFEIPDGFDPRPAQIKALKEKQKKAAADFHAMNTEIMRQIQELQALEMQS